MGVLETGFCYQGRVYLKVRVAHTSFLCLTSLKTVLL